MDLRQNWEFSSDDVIFPFTHSSEGAASHPSPLHSVLLSPVSKHILSLASSQPSYHVPLLQCLTLLPTLSLSASITLFSCFFPHLSSIAISVSLFFFLQFFCMLLTPQNSVFSLFSFHSSLFLSHFV